MVRKLTSTYPLALAVCLCSAGTVRAAPDEESGQDAGTTDTVASSTAAGADAGAPEEPTPGAATDAEDTDATKRIDQLERRITELEARSAIRVPEASTDVSTIGPEGAEGTHEELPPLHAHIKPLGAHLSVFGAIWIDTGYINRTDERPGQFDFKAPYMQGRFVLGAQYYQEFREKNFVLVKAAFIGFVNEYTKSQFEPRMEDVYIMVGQKLWDVQIGRYLAWEVYYRGNGIELFTAEEAGAAGGPPIYWLQVTRGYRNESGQMAVHFYPWGEDDCPGGSARRYMGLCDHAFGIEVSSVYGQENNQNNYGVRPAIDLQYHGFELMAGYEFLKLSPQTDASSARSKFNGLAGRLQYAVDLVSVGVEGSWATQNRVDAQDQQDAVNTLKPWTTIGGYLNFRKGIHWPGIGMHYTSEKNSQLTSAGQREQRTQFQGFVSYLIKLPVKGLALKFVYGVGVANLQDVDTNSEFHNVMQSGRIRIVYDPLGTLNRQDYP
ncbi:MAG: hypothetical protein WCF10_14455 [Polyangiales bacterium]